MDSIFSLERINNIARSFFFFSFFPNLFRAASISYITVFPATPPASAVSVQPPKVNNCDNSSSSSRYSYVQAVRVLFVVFFLLYCGGTYDISQSQMSCVNILECMVLGPSWNPITTITMATRNSPRSYRCEGVMFVPQ